MIEIQETEGICTIIESKFKKTIEGEVAVFIDDGEIIVKSGKSIDLPLCEGKGETVELQLRYTDDQLNDLIKRPASTVVPLEAGFDVYKGSEFFGMTLFFEPEDESMGFHLVYQKKRPVLYPGWDSLWEEATIGSDTSGNVDRIDTSSSLVRGLGKNLKEKFLDSGFKCFRWAEQAPSSVDAIRFTDGSPWALMFCELGLPTRFENETSILVGEDYATAADITTEIYKKLLQTYTDINISGNNS